MARRSRADVLRIASSCVDALDRRLLERERGVLQVGNARITVARALNESLALKVAGVLGSPDVASATSALSVVRRHLYSSRQRLMRPLLRARGMASWPATARTDRNATPLLMVPRRWTHLRDLMPVARHAESTGRYACWWLAFKTDDLETLRTNGHSAVLVDCFAPPALEASVRLRLELGMERLDRTSERPGALDPSEWSLALEVMLSELTVMLSQLHLTARAISRALESVGPRLIVVGSPRTCEGTLAVAAARAHGIPTLAVQHGQIGVNEAWATCGVDRLAAWGPRSKDTLVKLGFPEERIIVTGAPWLDHFALERHTHKAPGARRRILVALSGAGHSVGMDEHLGHVARLMGASQKLPQHTWIYRLHQKDAPEIYRRMLRDMPGSTGTIVDPRTTEIDIHTHLADIDILITVTSTAALDAMLHRIPVVTLGRPPEEPLPPHAQAGATTHVPMDAPLDEVLASLFERGQDATTTAHAQRYLADFFGEIDGHAAERVVGALVALQAGSRPAGR